MSYRCFRRWLALLVGLFIASQALAVTFTESVLPAWASGYVLAAGDSVAPVGAVVGDFDEDGVADLVVINNDGYSPHSDPPTNYPTVLFYKGDHLGHFGTAVGYNLLSPDLPRHSLPGPEAIAKADLNNDGYLDLVVGGNAPDDAPFGPFVLFGNGDGTFQAAIQLSLPGGSSSSVNAIEIRDVNNDGWNDIIATVGYHHALGAGTDLVVWTSVQGQFFGHNAYNIGEEKWFYGKSLVVGEFGGDGNDDIVIADPLVGLLFFKGNGNGTFDDPVVKFTAAQFQAFQFAQSRDMALGATIRDVDGDQCNDYVLGLYNEVVLFRGHCNDTFSAPVRIGLSNNLDGNDFVAKPVVADFNRDQRKDVVYGGRLFLQQPNGTFISDPQAVTGIGMLSFAASDLNHDGVPDLIGTPTPANHDGSHISVYYSTSGPATHVELIGDGQSVTVNTAFPAAIGVRVLDAANNPISGVDVVLAAAANATIPGGHGFTGSNGIFTATATAGAAAGCYTVTATFAAAGAGLPAEQINLCNTWSNAIQRVSGSSQAQQINQNFVAPLVGRVVDGNGNPLAGVTVLFSTASGARSWLSANAGGPWSLSLTATSDQNGLVLAWAQANGVTGTYFVNMSSPNAVAGQGFELTNTVAPGAPAKVVVTSPSPVSALLGQQYNGPIVAQLQDSSGTPILNGGTLVFAQANDPTTAAGASLSTGATPCTNGSAGPVTATIDAAGNATIYGCANTWPGTGKISVGLQGNANVTPGSATLYNFANNPQTLDAQSGTPQSAPVGTVFVQLLRVRVLDSNGVPIPQVPVRFSAPDSGASASLSGLLVYTDQNGEASVTATANGTVGSYQVTATAARNRTTTLTTTFDLSNTAAAVATDPVAVPALGPLALLAMSGLVGLFGWGRRFR